MKIWRVEDKNGIGCYQHITDHPHHYDIIIDHTENTPKDHPTPINDKGIGRFIDDDEICGFLNKEQAVKWFSERDLKELREAGFELKEVEVEKITAIGEKQILAIRCKSLWHIGKKKYAQDLTKQNNYAIL